MIPTLRTHWVLPTRYSISSCKLFNEKRMLLTMLGHVLQTNELACDLEAILSSCLKCDHSFEHVGLRWEYYNRLMKKEKPIYSRCSTSKSTLINVERSVRVYIAGPNLCLINSFGKTKSVHLRITCKLQIDNGNLPSLTQKLNSNVLAWKF